MHSINIALEKQKSQNVVIYILKKCIVFQTKLAKPAEVNESTGRNMKTNRFLSKCNFYFCLIGKTKFDHMLVLRERKI